MNSRQQGDWRVPPRDLPDTTVITRTLTAEERHRYGLDTPKEDDTMSKELTDTQIRAIRAAWAQGISGLQIAQRLQLGVSTVYKYRPLEATTSTLPDDVTPGSLPDDMPLTVEGTSYAREGLRLIPQGVATESPSMVEAALDTLMATLDQKRREVAKRMESLMDQRHALEDAIDAASDAVSDVEDQQDAVTTVRALLGLPHDPSEVVSSESEEPE